MMNIYNYKLNNQDGSGLIEVLISLLILAIAILGYVAVQGNALRLTDESSQRTHALVLMRDIGERIRMNPEGLQTYRGRLNSANPAAPAEGCGLLPGSASTNCTAQELAIAESYLFVKKMNENEFTIKMVVCPSTGQGNSSSIMYSSCLVTAWGDTNATIGADNDPDDGSMDCLTEPAAATSDPGGSYHQKSTCLLMELT